MLYYQFNGYEGFKEIFGIQEHGNGVKSRRNKILLALMTSREFIHAVRNTAWSHGHTARVLMERFYALKSMADMRQLVLDAMHTEVFPLGDYDGYTTDCYLLCDKEQHGYLYRLKSLRYEVMDGGICFDGDFKAVRYKQRENGKIYKMKAGKFMRRLIDENPFGAILPEQVKVWMCEDFTERWIAYARGKCTGFRLHVGGELEDFGTIYDNDNYEGDFGSCMAGEGQYAFYYHAVSARASCLGIRGTPRQGNRYIYSRNTTSNMKTRKNTFDTGDLCALLAVVAVSLVFIGNICSIFCPLDVAYTIIMVGFACLIVLLIAVAAWLAKL